MSTQGRSPFDDASGQQLIDFLANRGGVGAVVRDVTATGSTIDDAFQSSAGTILVTTAAAGTGVRLDATLDVGQSQQVYNAGANSVEVYPPDAGQRIALDNPGDPTTLAVGDAKTFTRLSNTLWSISGNA